MANEQMYNDPAGGTASDIGSQIRTDYYHKKALVEAAKEQYFSQLADTISMPKNMGKTIKRYHYLPLLDDRNLNEQGIDGSGNAQDATSNKVAYIGVLGKDSGGTVLPTSQTFYFRGDSTDADDALDIAQGKFLEWAYSKGYTTSAAVNDTDTDGDIAAAYAELVDGSADAVSEDEVGGTAGDYVVTSYAVTTDANYGNLYGSSKDIGTINTKIPALSETGGRVNRVGMTRIELSGSISKFGMYEEYTQESIDFDSDAELEMHMRTELVKGANEINEDQLMIDLINGAGVIRYTGSATSADTLQGNDLSSPFDSGNTNDAVSYDDLVKLGIELDNNRCPKNTKLISGSRMIDTKVVNAARYCYIGSELLPSIMRLTDYHGNKAFIPVAQYAQAGNVARGEVGAIDNFRFIVVPEMAHWAAAGAVVTDPDAVNYYHFGYDETADSMKFDVFPMLVVGDGSFTTIGFQTDGKTVKFKITHKKPGAGIASLDDPYGEIGFISIKWYYGTMILRPERIALVKTIAEI